MTADQGLYLAVAFLALVAVAILAANPIAKRWARNEAATDQLVADALDDAPDYEANVIAFDRMGRTR